MNMENPALYTTIMVLISVLTVRAVPGIFPDPRAEPGEMNQEPGNYLNIFPTLTALQTGYITKIKLYSAGPGDVMISFWENVEVDVFTLVAMVPVSADGTGLEEFVPNENVLVYEGNALGIHYTDSEAEGVIYYENALHEPRFDVPIYPVYDLDYQGIFPIGEPFDLTGRFKDEDSGKNVAIHVEISQDALHQGTEESTGTAQNLVCETLKADDREEPARMNRQPGNWFNLFPTLAVERPGQIASVSFYAAQAGDVVVSFWHETDENQYTLTANVPVTSSGPGLQTIIPEELTYVNEGDVLGIYYHSDEDQGVIFYEFYDEDIRLDVSLHEFYTEHIHGDWDVGHNLDLSGAQHTTDIRKKKKVPTATLR